MTGGRRARPGRVGRGMLVLLGVVAALALSAGPAAAAGGPVILGGDDLTDHGSRSTSTNTNRDGWLYLEKALENIAPAVSRPGNDGSIAALGSADSTSTSANAGAAIHFAAQDAGAGIPVTYYDGAAAINQFFNLLRAGTAKPAIIWIAGNESINDLDGAEASALAGNATTLGDFVNSGGGLISHGVEYAWLSGLFPGATVVLSGSSGDLVLTSQGQAAFPGLTNADVNAGPWHSHFEGNLGGLASLVLSTNVNDGNGADARVIVGGVGVVLPGSITLDPPTAVNLIGTNHTVTATVRNDQGQLQQGTTVTFTVTSGPNQGDTGTAVTGATGQASFTWLGDGGAGTDTVQASFVDSGGSTRSTTATKDWVEAPPISILPIEGVPAVAVASLAVVLLWRRRQRSTAA
jgi:hypothetical protein